MYTKFKQMTSCLPQQLFYPKHVVPLKRAQCVDRPIETFKESEPGAIMRSANKF